MLFLVLNIRGNITVTLTTDLIKIIRKGGMVQKLLLML